MKPIPFVGLRPYLKTNLLIILGIIVLVLTNVVNFHSTNVKLYDSLLYTTNGDTQIVAPVFSTGTSRGRNKDGIIPAWRGEAINAKDISECSICKFMEAQNSLQLWFDHKERILQSSKRQFPSLIDHQNEELTDGQRANFEKWLRQMFDYLSPYRLLKSVKNIPGDRDTMERIFNIVQTRYSYFVQQRKKDKNYRMEEDMRAPPPLKILVTGGSVTLGSYCHINPIHKIQYKDEACNWPARLQRLINDSFGFLLVHIENVSVGGTSSDVGSRILRLKILPDTMLPVPDIVINAYSSNDMHIARQTGKAGSLVEGLSDNIFRINEEFTRAVIAAPNHQCMNTPLLIYLSDHVGNYIKVVKDTMIFNHVIDQLTSYYNLMYVSYADAVRDMVYSNADEAWFSPAWPMGKDKVKKRVEQIHHGMGGHMAITWILAFNFLHAIKTYCDMASIPSISNTNMDSLRRENDLRFYGQPGKIPSVPPPSLTDGITLDEIANRWKNNAREAQSPCEENSFHQDPCIFKWLLGTQNAASKVPKLMRSSIVKNEGWAVESASSGVPIVKRGWAAIDGTNSSFVMLFKNINQDVHDLNFFVMHSYGEKWVDSKVLVEVFGSGVKVKSERFVGSVELKGYHDSETSITYPYEVDLGSMYVPKGGTLRVRITLISGNYFKFTGMGFCALI